MDTYYYVKLDGQQYGPYELEKIQSFELLPDILVFSTSIGQWNPASTYPELVGFLSVNIDNAQYYLQLDGQIYGPFSLVELSFLDIKENSILSMNNIQDWQPAYTIPGLLSTLKSLQSTEPSLDTTTEKPVLNEDDLKTIIEEQEEEIGKLKDQLSDLKTQKEQVSNIPTFDISVDGGEKYRQLEEEICSQIRKNIITPEGLKVQYKKVFPSIEKEKEYYINEYKKFICSITETLKEIADRTQKIQSLFDEDISLLENNLQIVHNKCISEQKKEELNLRETVDKQIHSLGSSFDHNITSESLKQYLHDHQITIVEKYKQLKKEEIQKISSKKEEMKIAFDEMRRHIIESIIHINQKNEEYFSFYFDRLYETSKIDLELWNKIDDRGTLPSSQLLAGHKEHKYCILGENISIFENYYVKLLNNQNLIITYNNDTKQQALKVVNSLLGRLLASSSPGKVSLTMIDSDEMDGTCDMFKYLNRTIFQILAHSDEIRKCLEEKERLISNIIQNLLLGSIKSLFDYNQIKENKESYHVIVVEDFPVGINNESLYLLQKIMKNGIRAGISVILLINEDKINYSDDTQKSYNSIHLEKLKKDCTVYDFTKNDSKTQFHFDSFSDRQLQNIVQYVNDGVEIRQEDTILFADYVLPESKWWERKSAKYIEIPFGVSRDKQVQGLKITQESGQNSAVVIGIPGSGKSVFLHTLICNAATIYSPDELNMYLIDFSGVEFNSYALHSLPHARVIAPEAEREFGLSILNELVEEGSRRMDLCRDNDVSNIVDLKAKNPSVYLPRLLVIIDEFQKIFEIENDQISREANSKIHTIIQEFRKFGINLILATQKLPSSSILPKDLIANRIVFKSSPADFSALISLQSNIKVPQLHTGECIYNSESGSPYDNHQAQGFLIMKANIDKLLEQILKYEKVKKYARHHEMRTFRGNELPEFKNRRMLRNKQEQSALPDEVGIYFGESISINDTDVCAALRKESGNNILVIGGEAHVAQRIAYYAVLSATMAHSDRSATFFTLNFMRRDDALNEEIAPMFDALPFDSSIISKQTDIAESLSAVKEEIEMRRQDEERPQNHIYITIYAFQLARMFDKGGRRGDDVSECGLLLDYVLKNGPAVGAFTILQCDNYENLSRIGNSLTSFNYRIALQMTENDSNKIVGSSIANKLFIFNRPSSVFRAYFRDNNRNITIKFKPYK